MQNPPTAANESRLRLAAIVESSDDAIVGKDLNGIVASWNKAAERMFGYSAAEMIGKPITTIFPPELQDQEREILERLAAGEHIEHFETVRLAKSGARIEVSLTIFPIKDDYGRVIGAAKIARDIGERRRAEKVLHMSERLASAGRLAATVAHEINNPLECAVNLVYLAKTHPSASPPVRELLQAAEGELGRVMHLTRQTLGFYREQRAPVPVRIGSLLQQLVSAFSAKASSKGIDVRLEVEYDPEVVAVPGELRRLFANLLSNSIDAVGSRGFIRIRASKGLRSGKTEEPPLRVSVYDSGPGIPADIRENIFDPFETTKQESGTGLGLWLCREIAQRHCGSIRIRCNTNPGSSWTVFSVELPVEQAQQSPIEIRKAA